MKVAEMFLRGAPAVQQTAAFLGRTDDAARRAVVTGSGHPAKTVSVLVLPLGS